MRTLANGQRVKVVAADRASGACDADGVLLNAVGTVVRVRTDGGAWVALDERRQEPVHPFDDGERRTHVLAYPENCEVVTARGKATRTQRRRNTKIAAEPKAVTIDMFGKDHWSTFAYVASVALDNGGIPVRERMRCDCDRHPFHAHTIPGLSRSTYPTRLKGDAVLQDHDDWDCVDDLTAAGLVENRGTTVNPAYRLTEAGLEVWKQLFAHKQNGENFATFSPVANVIARGYAQAQDDIVAWLATQGNPGTQPRDYAQHFADRISRGDHVPARVT